MRWSTARVREHDALRWAGRARRVQDHRGVLLPQVGRRRRALGLVEARRDRGPRGDPAGQVHRPLPGSRRLTITCSSCGRSAGDGGEMGQERLVDHERAGVRVIDDVAKRGTAGGGVDRDLHEACLLAGRTTNRRSRRCSASSARRARRPPSPRAAKPAATRSVTSSSSRVRARDPVDLERGLVAPARRTVPDPGRERPRHIRCQVEARSSRHDGYLLSNDGGAERTSFRAPYQTIVRGGYPCRRRRSSARRGARASGRRPGRARRASARRRAGRRLRAPRNQGRPTRQARAPSARALTTSSPRRTPPSRSTSALPPTASTTEASDVEGRR